MTTSRRKTSKARGDEPAPTKKAEADRRDFDVEGQRLGDIIRELRINRRFSLQTLGARCGLSVASLSQIERGLTAPSMRSLRQVANGLGVPVATLFLGLQGEEENAVPNIVRHDQRRMITVPESDLTIEIVSSSDVQGMQIFHAYMPPGGGSGGEYESHIGMEAGTILTGQMDLWLGPTRHRLNPGDSFSFNSTTPHRFLNPGNCLLQAYWAVSPPIY